MTESELAALRCQNALLQLQMDWDLEERRLMGGPPRVSAQAHRLLAISVGAATALLGLGVTILSLVANGNAKETGLVLLMGLVLVVGGVAAGLFIDRARCRYERAHTRYKRRRAALLGEVRPAGPQKNLRSATMKPKLGKRGPRRRARR